MIKQSVKLFKHFFNCYSYNNSKIFYLAFNILKYLKCLLLIDDCLRDDVCNGRGKCTEIVEYPFYKCECNNPYVGKDCKNQRGC